MKEQMWTIWELSTDDINIVLDDKELEDLSDVQIDEVAQLYKESIEALLGSEYKWYDLLEDAIREVKGDDGK